MYVLEMYIRYEILRILKDRRFCDDSQGKKKKKKTINMDALQRNLFTIRLIVFV